MEKNDILGIITFDKFGVSGHPNHIDTYEGVKIFYDDEKSNGKIKFYKLESNNILRKYIGILDLFFCILFSNHTDFIYINLNPYKSWTSMKIHKSQFVWYRKLFVIFSKYCYVNVIQEMK